MQSNYRKIGDFIQLVDVRNKDLEVNQLLGLSIRKIFIPSVANTIGTNMKNYKIIRKGQFACSIMQVRRDKKMPIALLQDFEEAIISQAYPVFEVINENKLLPEYLMMWFSRSEFDRQATFYAVGGVRGSLEWEDFLDFELPIPTIKKQQEIVNEYNTIVNRIKLNDQLNQKLEETAQSIYKHWFVDFEFPNKDGEFYKSNGGKMIFNEELERDIPVGWRNDKVENSIKYNSASYSKDDNYTSIEYLDTSSITNNKIEELQALLVGTDTIPSRAKRKISHNDIVYSTIRPNLKHFGIIKNPKSNMLVSTGFMVIQSDKENVCSELIYMWLTNKKIIKYLQSKAEMSVSTYPSIKPEDILNIDIVIPKEKSILNRFEKLVAPMFNEQWIKNKENSKLEKLKDLILSKMSKVELEKKTA